jgi:hypothetical protein
MHLPRGINLIILAIALIALTILVILFALALPEAFQSAIAACGFFVAPLPRASSRRCATKKPARLSSGRLRDPDWTLFEPFSK